MVRFARLMKSLVWALYYRNRSWTADRSIQEEGENNKTKQTEIATNLILVLYSVTVKMCMTKEYRISTI